MREKKEFIAKFYRPCDFANFALFELVYFVTNTTQVNIKIAHKRYNKTHI